MCLPKDGVSHDQTIRIVVKWSEEHTAELYESARTSVLIGLQGFPVQVTIFLGGLAMCSRALASVIAKLDLLARVAG
jgi:hypothetical protein